MTEDNYKAKMKRLALLLPYDKFYRNSDGAMRGSGVLKLWSQQGFMPSCFSSPKVEIQCRMKMANEIYKMFLSESPPKTYKLVCTWTLDTWSPK